MNSIDLIVAEQRSLIAQRSLELNPEESLLMQHHCYLEDLERENEENMRRFENGENRTTEEL